MEQVPLMEHLKHQTKEKNCFSVRDLKKQYPKDKKEIESLVFIGILEPVSLEYPDNVRASVY